MAGTLSGRPCDSPAPASGLAADALWTLSTIADWLDVPIDWLLRVQGGGWSGDPMLDDGLLTRLAS